MVAAQHKAPSNGTMLCVDHHGEPRGPWLQAARACEDKTGSELDNRVIMVREDREDRDIKRTRKPASRPQREGEPSGLQVRPAWRVCSRAAVTPACVFAATQRMRPGRLSHSTCNQLSLTEEVGVCAQVVVHGVPWSFDDEQLAALFTSFEPPFGIEAAEIVYGKDGRSRACPPSSALQLLVVFAGFSVPRVHSGWHSCCAGGAQGRLSALGSPHEPYMVCTV